MMVTPPLGVRLENPLRGDHWVVSGTDGFSVILHGIDTARVREVDARRFDPEKYHVEMDAGSHQPALPAP